MPKGSISFDFTKHYLFFKLFSLILGDLRGKFHKTSDLKWKMWLNLLIFKLKTKWKYFLPETQTIIYF